MKNKIEHTLEQDTSVFNTSNFMNCQWLHFLPNNKWYINILIFTFQSWSTNTPYLIIVHLDLDNGKLYSCYEKIFQAN